MKRNRENNFPIFLTARHGLRMVNIYIYKNSHADGRAPESSYLQSRFGSGQLVAFSLGMQGLPEVDEPPGPEKWRVSISL